MLDPATVHWSTQASCTVVVAARGYPDQYPVDIFIKGIEQAEAIRNVAVFHSGTTTISRKSSFDGRSADEASQLRNSGGRVLSITALGSSLKQAIDQAYTAVAKIKFENDQMYYRKDIGQRALNSPLLIGVLGSTRGTSFQAIIDAIESNSLHATRLAIVISNKEDAFILERAKLHHITSVFIPCDSGTSREAYDGMLATALEKAGVELVLLIGFMRILSSSFITRFENRILNVHPSLLPAFAGGMDISVHKAVLAAGVAESGCTVHFVSDCLDAGPIVVQKICTVEKEETVSSLKGKIQALEGIALLEAIEIYRSSRATSELRLSYQSVGVDISLGNALVDRIKPLCFATRRPGSDASLGGFGGLFDLDLAGWGDGSDTVVSTVSKNNNNLFFTNNNIIISLLQERTVWALKF